MSNNVSNNIELHKLEGNLATHAVNAKSGLLCYANDAEALAYHQGAARTQYTFPSSGKIVEMINNIAGASGYLPGPSGTVTVSASGADYTTIQAALDDNVIVGLVVEVYEGTYVNDTVNFTANNQSVMGMGCAGGSTVITNTAQISDFGAFTGVKYCNIKFIGTYTSAINMITGTGSASARFCHFEASSTGTFVSGHTIITTSGTFKMHFGSMISHNNVTSAGLTAKRAVNILAGGFGDLESVNITITGTNASFINCIIFNEAAGTTRVIGNIATVTDNDTTLAIGVVTSNGSGDGEAYYNILHVNNTGGQAIGIYLDSNGTDLKIRTMYNHFHCVGATTIGYLTAADANVYLDIQYDDIIADTGISKGAGSHVTYLYSDEDGKLSVSEQPTATDNLTPKGYVDTISGVLRDDITDLETASGYLNDNAFFKDGTRKMTGNIQLNDNYLSNNGDASGILMNDDSRVGVGKAPSETYQFAVQRNVTDQHARYAGFFGTKLTVDNDGTYTTIGSVYQAIRDGNADNTAGGTLSAFDGSSYVQDSTGIQENVRGATLQYGATLSTFGGTITNNIGLYLRSMQRGGAITNNYDLYIAGQGWGTSTVTNDWAIYCLHSAPSLLRGDLQIDADNKKLYLGAAQDASITYDGADLVIDPQEVGNGGLIIKSMKSGATQATAGAAVDELWKTASHASLPDNVVMIGV